jgi:hypothetical protein
MLNRIMSLLAIGISLSLPLKAIAQDANIFEVRRNIPLADDEPIYKDFYIATQGNSSFKRNLVVNVFRKLNMKDAAGVQSMGELLVPVGQLRIIAVQGKIAVAREYKLTSHDDQPMLEQPAIMIGDRIELDGAFSAPTEKKKSEGKEKSAENLTNQSDKTQNT